MSIYNSTVEDCQKLVPSTVHFDQIGKAYCELLRTPPDFHSFDKIGSATSYIFLLNFVTVPFVQKEEKPWQILGLFSDVMNQKIPTI